MANTYNYLRTVFQKLRLENKDNPSLFFLLLVLWCIPLSYGCNSVALALLCGYTLFTFQRRQVRFEVSLILPVAVFVLMSLSLIWTKDMSLSLRALSKGLPFLLIPLCFAILPKFDSALKTKAVSYYSYGIVAFTIFYLLKAVVRFLIGQGTGVFFYHELVTEDVNAIHVSVYTAVAIFYFLSKPIKTRFDRFAIILLNVFLVLLSSKNIIIIYFLLVGCYYLWHFKSVRKKKILQIGAFTILLFLVVFSGKIRQRFAIEYDSNVNEKSVNYDIGTDKEKVYNVSVKRAWTAERFEKNDFFPGTAFRVYQIRIFTEMLREDPIFWSGYGLNASDFRIEEKRIEHGLYEGYGENNFHDQYIQFFAELGFFGFLLLLAMVVVNLKNALKSKDFVHISFAVLMISLFLTESFLSRQRGIIFFTMMYCLLNAGNTKVHPKKQ